MYAISKDFTFSASHVLTDLPEGHPCARLHGHNYIVRVELSSTELDEHGMVFDYRALAPFGQWIDDTLDHRHLNDLTLFKQDPTAELLAFTLWAVIGPLVALPDHVDVAVGVSETPKTWAWWRA